MKSAQIQTQLQPVARQLLKFRLPLFLLMVVLIYGFVVSRINALKDVQPSASQTAIAARNTTSVSPQIDPATISKIRQLQDNSVSVQALFNQARQNPFQE